MGLFDSIGSAAGRVRNHFERANHAVRRAADTLEKVDDRALDKLEESSVGKLPLVHGITEGVRFQTHLGTGAIKGVGDAALGGAAMTAGLLDGSTERGTTAFAGRLAHHPVDTLDDLGTRAARAYRDDPGDFLGQVAGQLLTTKGAGVVAKGAVGAARAERLGYDAVQAARQSGRLRAAGVAATDVPVGARRADFFQRRVMPELLDDAARVIGADPRALERALEPALRGSGRAGKTLGLQRTAKGLEPDPNYPPRAANATWPAFARAAGVSEGDARRVTELNREIGAVPLADGQRAPSLDSLPPKTQRLVTRVSRSLAGERVALGPLEKAFRANLVHNNLTWHMTNFQRAAADASRVDPALRDGVFNAYSTNLRGAKQAGGLPAVIDMALSDAYNAGKPGVGVAKL